MTAVDEQYEKLVSKIRQIHHLSSAKGVLHWDQQVMMPEGGTPARSKQLSTIEGIRHRLLVDDEIDSLLHSLETADLSDEQRAIVRETRRIHDRASRVPQSLIEEIRETVTDAHPIWETAREDDDFEHFAPQLEAIIDLKRQYAEHIDPDEDPYAVLFADYEPYLPLSTAESVLESLRDALIPLIDEINAVDADLTLDTFDQSFDPATQEAFSETVLDELGYDWEHGRLDRSTHPFTSGNVFDARVTSRFGAEDFLSGLYATIHEFGHAQYELGLDQDHFGTPLGQSRDLTVHESQSRFWENHVGRTESFWEYMLPIARQYFDPLESVTPRDAYEASNQVYTDNFIRVEADELTYHLHIVIRFEIERDLISGDLAVEDVPAVWNDKYESYLGIRPDTDTIGCLQDIHWSGGNIGYFPTYSLGSVLSAQLTEALESDIGPVDEQVASGDFHTLMGWMRTNVHQHGCRYTTPDLIEEATGSSYSATPFIDYVTEKYRSLYGL